MVHAVIFSKIVRLICFGNVLQDNDIQDDR